MTRSEDKAQLLKAYRDMYRAMLAGRTDQLNVLVSDQYSVTHMTGSLQPKHEWLSAIDSGHAQAVLLISLVNKFPDMVERLAKV